MTAFEFGDIDLVPFPFTDQSAAKQRPAVVISSEAYHRTRPDLLIMSRRKLGRLEPEDLRALRGLLPTILGS